MRTTTLNSKGKTFTVYYFDTRYFSVDGKMYEITGTEIIGFKADDAVHTLRDVEKKVHHRALVKLFKQGKLT